MRTLQRMGSLVLVLAGFTAGHVARADDTGDSHRQQCKEAFKACAESSGLPERGSGTRPTQAQMEAAKSCVETKTAALGITCRPPHHHHGEGRGQGGAANDQVGQ